MTQSIDLKTQDGDSFTIETSSGSTYYFMRDGGYPLDHVIIGGTKRDGFKRYHEQNRVQIRGCTFGGSMIKMDYLQVGMHLELFDCRQQNTLTTSSIKTITVGKKNETMDE